MLLKRTEEILGKFMVISRRTSRSRDLLNSRIIHETKFSNCSVHGSIIFVIVSRVIGTETLGIEAGHSGMSSSIHPVHNQARILADKVFAFPVALILISKSRNEVLEK
jgi:hypothetical protein